MNYISNYWIIVLTQKNISQTKRVLKNKNIYNVCYYEHNDCFCS